jgi:hypothetical protein
VGVAISPTHTTQILKRIEQLTGFCPLQGPIRMYNSTVRYELPELSCITYIVII